MRCQCSQDDQSFAGLPVAARQPKSLLTGDQMRAARALLRWSAEDLSRRSSVSLRTIRRAEIAEGQTMMAKANNLSIRRVLEAAGRGLHR